MHPHMTRTRRILLIAVAFITGFGTCAVVTWLWRPADDASLAWHWSRVEEYRAYITNRTNAKPHGQFDLSSITPPREPLGSLAALVEAGELEHVDVILPRVRRVSERHWMNWAEGRTDIVIAYSTTDPGAEEYLHLRLWFRPSAGRDVEKLIAELKELAERGDGPVAPGRVARQASAPSVPDHPLRGRFIGQWQSDGDTVLVIETLPIGTVTLRSTQEHPWQSVINNVRWSGDALHYDEYWYYVGDKDFSGPANPSGNHPFSGVRGEVALRLMGDAMRIRQTASTEHTPEPIQIELTKAPN
jgi:hypothetical protein